MNAETWIAVVDVYDHARSYLQMVYEGAEFAQWLHRTIPVNFVDGVFIIEVPSEKVYSLFTRRSEHLSILQALQAATPREWGVTVGVDFTIGQDVDVGQGRQVTAEPDYLEMEAV